MESTNTAPPPLKAGDICIDCRQHKGLENRLCYFLINLEDEALLKCESDECMYPYNDDISPCSSPLTVDEDGNNPEFYDTVNCFTELSSTTTNGPSRLNEFPKATKIQQTTTNVMSSQPRLSSNTQQQLLLPINKRSPELPIKSEYQNINKSPLFQFQTNSRHKTETFTKVIRKTDKDQHPPDCSVSFSQAKTAIVPASIQGIPKASLIKGRQFLKQVEANKKPFFNHKVKNPKGSTEKIKKVRKGD